MMKRKQKRKVLREKRSGNTLAIQWLGRYGRIVSALTNHSNIVNRALNIRRDMGGGIMLTAQELQVLENLISHEDENRIMNEIALDCGIPQSSMTKATQQLLKYKFVARYRLDGNMKNIILRPTEMGKQFYNSYVENEAKMVFEEFFAELAPLSDEQLLIFCNALEKLNRKLKSDSEQKLIEF